MSLNRPVDPEEDDDYRESEDEDYSPGAAEEEESDGDEDSAESRKLDAQYSKFQGKGGLIKTRAQRRAEAEGRAPKYTNDEPSTTPVVGQASIDIDALWKEMNGSSSAASSATPPTSSPAVSDEKVEDKPGSQNIPKARSSGIQEEYITITRTFKFAGEVKTETKRVPVSSAEGQDYIREQKRKAEAAEQTEREKADRVAQKKQGEHSSESGEDLINSSSSSAAQPPPAPRSLGRGPVKRKMSLMDEYKMNKTKKINTLEKSRLDWLGFVDKEGIRDDLSKHNKGGYLDRRSFLDRVDQKVDQDIRQQRVKRMQ